LGVTVVVAVVIMLVSVLPAEFGRDPTGLGRATGLLRLSEAPETVAYSPSRSLDPARLRKTPFRSDTVEIPLGYIGGGVGPYSLEYKVALTAGDVLLYEWEAAGLTDPAGLVFDFHGHTLPSGAEEKMVVASYRKGSGAAERGSLTAPMDGIHGWYFENRTGAPMVLRLRLIGAYELVPPGEAGNEHGIEANLPADQVRARMRSPGTGS
jgi:hypothetical protein